METMSSQTSCQDLTPFFMTFFQKKIFQMKKREQSPLFFMLKQPAELNCRAPAAELRGAKPEEADPQ